MPHEKYRASDLNQRVRIISRAEAQNEYGTLVPTDTTVATVWAKVEPMSGGERERGQQTEVGARYLVVIRYRSDVTEKHLLMWGSVELNIRFVRKRSRIYQYLEIETETHAPT